MELKQMKTSDIDYENRTPDEFNVGYDYAGNKWEICDYCQLKDEDVLEDFLRKYDTGACEDVIDEYEPDDYAVVAKREKEYAVFIWTPEGLWYEKL